MCTCRIINKNQCSTLIYDTCTCMYNTVYISIKQNKCSSARNRRIDKEKLRHRQSAVVDMIGIVTVYDEVSGLALLTSAAGDALVERERCLRSCETMFSSDGLAGGAAVGDG